MQRENEGHYKMITGSVQHRHIMIVNTYKLYTEKFSAF